MKYIYRYGTGAALFLTPVLALAQFGELNRFFQGVTVFIQGTIIPILIAVAFVVFVWGAIRYFLIADDKDGENTREAGRRLMFWGIIAFVIIVSVWGIVALISKGLGFNNQNLNSVPDAPALRNTQ